MRGTNPSPASEVLSGMCGEIAAAFRRQCGSRPLHTSARWAGRNMLVVVIEEAHTPAERALREAARFDELLQERQFHLTALQSELREIVGTATGRKVHTALSAARLNPDLLADIFIFDDEDSDADQAFLRRSARATAKRALELRRDAEAVTAEAHQVLALSRQRRDARRMGLLGRLGRDT